MMMRLGNAEEVEQSQAIMKKLDELQRSIVDLRWQLAKSLQASRRWSPILPASSGDATKGSVAGKSRWNLRAKSPASSSI